MTIAARYFVGTAVLIALFVIIVMNGEGKPCQERYREAVASYNEAGIPGAAGTYEQWREGKC